MERVLRYVLPPYELCKLGLYSYASERFFEIVRSRLKPDLLRKIEKTNSWISGSFILQCMYDCEWDGDIDIYESVTTNVDQFSKMENYMYIDCDFKESDPGFAYSQYDPNMRIVQTRKYNYNQKKYKNNSEDLYAYEIIKVLDCNTCEKQIEFTKQVFDFDICKNLLWVKDGKMRLYINCLWDIMTKSTDLKFGFHVASTLRNRVNKYTSRGIIIRNNPQANEIISEFNKPKFAVVAQLGDGGSIIAYDQRLREYERPGISFPQLPHTSSTWGSSIMEPDRWYLYREAICTCDNIAVLHAHLHRNDDYSDMRLDIDVIELQGIKYFKYIYN